MTVEGGRTPTVDRQHMLEVRDRIDVTIYRDPGAYAAHPCIVRLSNGDLLVAFNEGLPRRPWLHPPKDPRFVNLMARSRDGGHTWLTPRVIPSYAMTGVECPSITQLTTGDVLLVQWQFAWYPLEAARKLWRLPGNPHDIHLVTRQGWVGKRPTRETDWDETPFPWARGDAGLFVSLSRDDGATWDSTVRVPTTPFRRGYSPRPPAQLSDGTALLALDSHDERGVLYVLRSRDAGRSWEAPVVVSDSPPLAEPSILALPRGKVIIHSRHESSGLIHQHDSFDGGQTWAPPRPTRIWGYPAHLLRLSDGRLLTVYGHRRSPFGIRASLSGDDGETWDAAPEIIIRGDLPSGNLGYPTVVELQAGRLFVAYYGEDETGLTHILGSSFELP